MACRHCVIAFIGTIVLVSGLAACSTPAMAAPGEVTAGDLQYDADRLANGSVTHTETVEVHLSESADFGTENEQSEVQFRLRDDMEGIELENINPIDDVAGSVDIGDVGAVLLHKNANRSGESIRIEITLKAEKVTAESADFYRGTPSIEVVASDNQGPKHRSADTVINDPAINSTTTLPVSVTPGTPAAVETSLADRVISDTDTTTITANVRDAHRNQVGNASVTVSLIGTTDTWTTTATTTKTGTATISIGQNGSIAAPIGELTTQVTLPANETLETQHALTISPAAPTLKTNRTVTNATGDDPVRVTVDLGVTPARIDQYPLGLGYTSQGATGELHLQGTEFNATLSEPGTTTTEHGITTATRNYTLTVSEAGNYTIGADLFPTVDGAHPTNRVIAKTTFVSANTSIDQPLVGTVHGGTLGLTIADPHNQQGPVGTPQQALTGLKIGDIYRSLASPSRPTDRRYTPTVDLTRWNVSPAAVESMTAVFGENRSTIAVDGPASVHEQYQLSGTGWHRLSAPLPVSDIEYRGIRRTDDGAPLTVTWNGSRQQYGRLANPSGTTQLHRGWYVYVPEAVETARVGMTFKTTPTADRTAQLGAGWQLVGSNYNLSQQRTVTTDTDLAGVDMDDLTVVDNRTARGPLDTYWVYNETPIGTRTLQTDGYIPSARAQVLETTSTTRTAASTETGIETEPVGTLAAIPPGDPAYYTGTITVDGQAATDRTVTISAGDVNREVQTDQNGSYTVVMDSNASEEFTVQTTDTDVVSHPLETGTTQADINLQSIDTGGGGGGSIAPPPIPTPEDPVEPPPLLDIAMPETVQPDTTYEFAAQPATTSTDVNYTWRVGSESYTGSTVEHAFGEPGAYAVEVTATNAAGKQNTTSATVTIPADTNVTVDQTTTESEGLPWRLILAIAGPIGLLTVVGVIILRRRGS